VQIIRHASFRATPWKNGAGVTHEALRSPLDGPAFQWRVSVATVGASGPFSDFSGYRRHMVLLRGAGVQLQFADGSAADLRAVGDQLAFDGGMAVHCELLGGECTDLNLMVSTALPAPDVRVLRLEAEYDLFAAPHHFILLFPITGAVTVTAADGRPEILAPWDLALATAASDRTVRLSPVDQDSSAQVFLADLMDTA
jgi:environmental stress-induced protein Ves